MQTDTDLTQQHAAALAAIPAPSAPGTAPAIAPLSISLGNGLLLELKAHRTDPETLVAHVRAPAASTTQTVATITGRGESAEVSNFGFNTKVLWLGLSSVLITDPGQVAQAEAWLKRYHSALAQIRHVAVEQSVNAPEKAA